ncbi:hypothetical protein E4V51_08085 [Paenibacillus sp. 28ISP30-2]|uniref:hypothetical protein n=1 Tax=Paenibacillus sp. 23TSA30-6 TaxID=2546104 RepID=UPI001788673E|nr:hypothetical protein [Paenibacillus sp. 23TSA30-6]MBE0336163.1 hypothetical protein [Paenibacillus sp. 23TSA30-6]MBE0341184.1 hypothetical protein [Paenibacillus sp. 28ISP30-2]
MIKKNRNWIILFIGIAIMVWISDYFTEDRYTAIPETIIPKVANAENTQSLDYTLVHDVDRPTQTIGRRNGYSYVALFLHDEHIRTEGQTITAIFPNQHTQTQTMHPGKTSYILVSNHSNGDTGAIRLEIRDKQGNVIYEQ